MIATAEKRNVGASVRARLLNRARAEDIEFQFLLTRYALERFLYRLGLSEHRERFVLKGAMLFTVWRDNPPRFSQDVDFLGRGKSELVAVAEDIRSICSLKADDGVVFDADSIRAEPIRVHAEYVGVRVNAKAFIDRARLIIQIDIGFGDAVVPEAEEIEFPSMLDMPSPVLRAYRPETVIAEKLHAMVSHGLTNSRMKDFYDIWMIAKMFPFEGEVLGEAARRTFERCGTAWPEGMPVGLGDEFAEEKEALWQLFLERTRPAEATATLKETIEKLRGFLVPILEGEALASWPPGGPWIRA